MSGEAARYTLYVAILFFVAGLVGTYIVMSDPTQLTNVPLAVCISSVVPGLILCIAILVYLLNEQMDEARSIRETHYRRMELDAGTQPVSSPVNLVLADELPGDGNPPIRKTRVICPKCNEVEDVVDFKRPYEGNCRKCGARLVVRE